ncbi:MAG: asparagine synthase (glutamine-hydrolyzing) [Pseudomonadota bacterium]
MCGLLAVWSKGGVEPIRFDRALAVLDHRGPDDRSSSLYDHDRLALGHTRLSILDLSERANQPMTSGPLSVVFNGEIYNFQQLRTELVSLGCQFRTTSDTEVLLHGYRRWGRSLTERITGMFAFVLWDSTTRRLFVARDHFGQKPLYYADTPEGLVIASEIKAIKAYVNRSFRLRRESVIDAMVQDFVAEPYTWYEGIHSLSAGHELCVSMREEGSFTLTAREYWTFRPSPEARAQSYPEVIDELDARVRAAVSSHLVADVEVGAFLSGGADSTCVATLASAELTDPIKTYSIGFGGDDELPIARHTAQRIGSKHVEGQVVQEDYARSLDQALRIFDQPFADSSLVPMKQVSRLAAEDVKVVLTGDGGDECFGGYDYGRFLAPGLGKRPMAGGPALLLFGLFQRLRDQGTYMLRGQEAWRQTARERISSVRRLSKRRRGALAPGLLLSLAEYDPSWPYRAHTCNSLDPFRVAQWVGIKVPLASKMLVKVDRCSMSHSLETRAPFLTPSLVEWMLDLPVTTTNPSPIWYKALFREWLGDKVSQQVLNAPKRGFSLPKHWASIDLPSSSRELFPECVSAELLRPAGWEDLRSNPHLLWHLAQIERALETGELSL